MSSPAGLGGINDQFASDLVKLTVTLEEESGTRTVNLVVKAALQSLAAWTNVIFGTIQQSHNMASYPGRRLCHMWGKSQSKQAFKK